MKTHKFFPLAAAILLSLTLVLNPIDGLAFSEGEGQVNAEPAATGHTVNSTGDGSDATPGNGVCETATGNKICTLRAAIEESNAASGTDIIIFKSSLGTIVPNSPLPVLDDASGGTTIRGNPTWILGSFAGTGAEGFVLESDDNKLQGLYITNFDGTGILVKGDDNIIGTDGDGTNDDSEGNVISSNGNEGVYLRDEATGNWVAGNLIGLTFDGTDDDGNGTYGVRIQDGAHTNRIGTNGDGTSDELERNVISGNDSSGITIVGDNVDHNVVAGNYIGTNAAGDAAVPNTENGVNLSADSAYTLVGTDGNGMADEEERNLISGNEGNGVMTDKSANNVIAGNYIGTNAAGNTAIPNDDSGVLIYTNSADNLVGTDGDGLADEMEGNLISGNGNSGVNLYYYCSGNVVAGNYIGTNAAGDSAIPNSSYGVYIHGVSTDNLIGTDANGTSDELEGNLISGNEMDGIQVYGSGGNVVAGNYIGTNAAGDAAIPNSTGVEIRECSNNRVGGTLAVERNLISGNEYDGVSIYVTSTLNLVQGNYIGTDASGSGDLGNGWFGMNISNGSSDNTIGGTTDGAANRIAFNGKAGIRVVETTSHNRLSRDNRIQGNAIFANSELGIDLYPDGLTPNDPDDGDAGANLLQNYPVLTSALGGSSQIVIEGTLDSKGNTTFELDFYANSSCDPSGYGEGETYLGADTVTTDGNGDVSFTTTLSKPVLGGYYVTATATDPDGNTSEFSQCRIVTAACTPVYDVDFDWSPTTPALDQLVTFNAEATGSLPITYTWNFGESGSTVTQTYSTTGDYIVVMTATNQCGEVPVSHTLTVVEEAVCTPVQIEKVTAEVSGCRVSFAADLYGDAPFLYAWDFGDNGTSTMPAPDHDFAASGTYTVTLQVNNCGDQGSDTHTIPVTVACTPSETKNDIYLPIVCLLKQ